MATTKSISPATPSAPATAGRLERNTQFLFEVGCLRYIPRSWIQFLGADFANLAEHIFRVIWIALMIAAEEQKRHPVDTGKMVKMALVHDLSESRSVDVHYVSRLFADRHEHAALKETLHDTSLETEFVALWEEYERRECLEAKIIKDADNLDVDFELAEQKARGVTLGQALDSMRQHVGKTKLYTQAARDILQQLRTSDPHDWHVQSSNRFNSGDWKEDVNQPA